ncbi:hypothetical protein BDZ89DRAFT_1069350 [Hymenopellis radicata]|nr:hypothetical protein BDZ89DRAFT_1069350 [Hymenopellis radicata]
MIVFTVLVCAFFSEKSDPTPRKDSRARDTGKRRKRSLLKHGRGGRALEEI